MEQQKLYDVFFAPVDGNTDVHATAEQRPQQPPAALYQVVGHCIGLSMCIHLKN